MASQKLRETKGPLIVALFFTLYPALLVTVFAPFTASEASHILLIDLDNQGKWKIATKEQMDRLKNRQ